MSTLESESRTANTEDVLLGRIGYIMIWQQLQQNKRLGLQVLTALN